LRSGTCIQWAKNPSLQPLGEYDWSKSEKHLPALDLRLRSA
jgi:hypothetical protein